MDAKLIVVGGKANKAEVNLTLPAIIGRGRDADLTVAHSTVSRRHCLLFEKEGALMVRDNGSLNGTLIEGERITEAVLRPGASLTVGPLTFRADYEHFGAFPDLSEQPTLPSVQEKLGDEQDAQAAATAHDPQASTAATAAAEGGEFDFLSEDSDQAAPEPALAEHGSELPELEDSGPAEAQADAGSEHELNLPELDPPAAEEEAPSFGFLSAADATPAVDAAAELPAENADFSSESTASEPAASESAAIDADVDFAEAPLAEAPADSGEIAGLDLLGDDDDKQLAADDDSPSFGFLGALDEPTASSEPESHLPEITLHDADDSSAAEADSGEYALSSESMAPPPNSPAAGEPMANDDNAKMKNGKHRGAADALPADSHVAESQSAKLAPDQPADNKKGWIDFGKTETADPEVDLDAAALDFLSDAPPGGAAVKSSKASGKPAQADATPEIKVGPERPKGAAPEDDELNNFFDSIGLQ